MIRRAWGPGHGKTRPGDMLVSPQAVGTRVWGQASCWKTPNSQHPPRPVAPQVGSFRGLGASGFRCESGAQLGTPRSEAALQRDLRRLQEVGGGQWGVKGWAAFCAPRPRSRSQSWTLWAQGPPSADAPPTRSHAPIRAGPAPAPRPAPPRPRRRPGWVPGVGGRRGIVHP